MVAGHRGQQWPSQASGLEAQYTGTTGSTVPVLYVLVPTRSKHTGSRAGTRPSIDTTHRKTQEKEVYLKK